MTLIEFIGLIVGLIGMVFLVLKQLWEDNRQRRNSVLDGDDRAEKHVGRDRANVLDLETDTELEQLPALRQNPERKQFLNSVHESKKISPPPPKPKDGDNYHLRTTVDQRRHKSSPELLSLTTSEDPYKSRMEEESVRREFLSDETAAYEIVDRKGSSRASLIIRGLPTPKNMVIIKEILGSPKSMDYER